MKKIFLILLCATLLGCDNNTITGKCIPTETENKFVCGCITGKNQTTPFIFSQERLLIETNSVTPNAISDCNKHCTDFCQSFTPDYILGNW